VGVVVRYVLAGAADWWALGVLLFHMLTGVTPFASSGDDELRIYKRIVRGMLATGGSLRAGQQLPAALAALPTDAADLISNLLLEDPTHRLGEVGFALVSFSYSFVLVLQDTACLAGCRRCAETSSTCLL
jgi:serine/threonine protein kinase